MDAYRPVIGLEVHAELATSTKMFCGSVNDPDETRPNINVCPVCMAHPGSLPVINREAVRQILRIGTAVGGRLADESVFDRKSYFYPDIPKGYQISQYLLPLVIGGSIEGIPLTRIHLEEDTARSVHAGGTSLVDFNRAGVPLMELVTEPAITDAETAGRFARELQLLLRTLGASGANLEKGQMRIEANISIAREGEPFGTKVEIKNLNSFRSVERAIAFEIKRQAALRDAGKEVVQETRGWNEAAQETFHQRFKEGSADYRYFPEPDLPKLFRSEIAEFSDDAIRASLPELPWEKRVRYETLGIRRDYVDALMQNDVLGTLFEGVVALAKEDAKIIQLAGNYIISDIQGLLEKAGEIGHAHNLKAPDLLRLMHMVKENSVSSRGAKDILTKMYQSGGDPETVAREHNLLQVHDTGTLDSIAEAVIAKEEKAVGEYRAGKQAALQYLIGKSMKESGGAGNPELLREIIQKKLG